MIVVTGGFGFIGSNLIKLLNARGINDIIIVDDIEDGNKLKNLSGCGFREYYDVDDFFEEFTEWSSVQILFHEGAISSTTEMNGKLLMKRNYDYSCKLFNKAIEHGFLLQYASSASVYGVVDSNTLMSENLPLRASSPYAFTKALFDMKVQRFLSADWFSQTGANIQGLRYFNVYGRNEQHKGDQASPITKFENQARDTGKIKIFEGSENVYRDFVCVEDLVLAKLELAQIGKVNGIFNIGSGEVASFRQVADHIARKYNAAVEVVPFPNNLKGQYQYWTKSDNTKLREAGIGTYFRTIDQYING